MYPGVKVGIGAGLWLNYIAAEEVASIVTEGLVGFLSLVP